MAGVLQRIFDLASIQRALRVPQDRSVDCAGYLAELCRSISAAKLQYRDIELEFVDCPLTLNSFECWRVGMIVAELINNAARHAFCDRGGRIQVAMTHRDCSIEFTVADNGRGRDNFCEGQGTKIVRHLAGVLEVSDRLSQHALRNDCAANTCQFLKVRLHQKQSLSVRSSAGAFFRTETWKAKQRSRLRRPRRPSAVVQAQHSKEQT